MELKASGKTYMPFFSLEYYQSLGKYSASTWMQFPDKAFQTTLLCYVSLCIPQLWDSISVSNLVPLFLSQTFFFFFGLYLLVFALIKTWILFITSFQRVSITLNFCFYLQMSRLSLAQWHIVYWNSGTIEEGV